jgi:hypothetical protein
MNHGICCYCPQCKELHDDCLCGDAEISKKEYQELMQIKRQHDFITTRLYGEIKRLDEDSKRLNKTAFVTNAGDTVQNIEWVKIRYKISLLLHFVPDEKLEELLK